MPRPPAALDKLITGLPGKVLNVSSTLFARVESVRICLTPASRFFKDILTSESVDQTSPTPRQRLGLSDTSSRKPTARIPFHPVCHADPGCGRAGTVASRRSGAAPGVAGRSPCAGRPCRSRNRGPCLCRRTGPCLRENTVCRILPCGSDPETLSRLAKSSTLGFRIKVRFRRRPEIANR